MPEETRTAAVVEFEGRTFIWQYRRLDSGLNQCYAITEAPTEPEALGRDLRRALDARWPDIAPAWKELINSLLAQTGVSSERRFVARSNHASIEKTGSVISVTPTKPDGHSGYVGVQDAPRYELIDATDAALGRAVLRALKDSANFPGRPSVR